MIKFSFINLEMLLRNNRLGIILKTLTDRKNNFKFLKNEKINFIKFIPFESECAH